MSVVIKLRGRQALSEFRLSKLCLAGAERGIELSAITAEFWHFVLTDTALSIEQSSVLSSILTYGPASSPEPPLGELLLVAPRPGTISPWSSKATDIARHCGLTSVERIERGIAYHLQKSGGLLTAAERNSAASLVHDRMTEAVFASFDEIGELFAHYPPAPLRVIELRADAKEALRRANVELGLALSEDEIAYLAGHFALIGRDPTDVELTMFAQANSEHCRHKIFNADWEIDGERMPHSLFSMIRNTHRENPNRTIVAYSDNSAVIEGGRSARLFVDEQGIYRFRDELTHVLMKVETHNHPTAISPFPGAATGAGGEIRDEGATGRGAKPKAGLTGFSVSNLRIPGFVQPWEADHVYGRPARIASALQIMLEGPIGGASFNNEFGRPNLCGYFRSFEQPVGGEMRGYHKPIMLAGGVGNIDSSQTHKAKVPAGALLIQLGGPGMLIGLGGGAASSMGSGANPEALDFNSVQRGNAEMQRRAQEVIERCAALGADNPILSIHDVGAGGLSNALPELVHGAARGAELDLRAVPSEEPGMSPLQIWCNEAQERYVLAISPERLPQIRELCERERCPYAVLGVTTEQQQLVVSDPHFANHAVDLALEVVLGKPPKLMRRVSRITSEREAFDVDQPELREAAYRVLRLPAVADKSFLITIGDRTVGGMTARDQMIGPWQVAVADVAVTLADFHGYRGEAFAIGERAPIALIDGAASARMAVGEALTNIAATPVAAIGDIKLSANWMAAAGHPGEDAHLYDAVKAVGMALCPALGISIPVGKDSLSMKTAWRDGDEDKEVTAPMSVVISAFAAVDDVRATMTPQLRTDAGETVLLLVDLGQGRNRLGGSALAQVHSQIGNAAPDVEYPELLKALFATVQGLNRDQKILAYHDRSDGGLFATLCEMMFASHTGVTVNLDALCFSEAWHDVDGAEIKYDANPGVSAARVLAALFAEELGAVIQVRKLDLHEATRAFREGGLGASAHVIGTLNGDDELRIMRGGKPILREKRVDLQRAWSETSYRMQGLRDHPACARAEYDGILDAADPGLSANLSFDPDDNISAPFIATGERPRIAILREQGVNGQNEMAAAFDRAGFTAIDVHMSDIVAARVDLLDFHGVAACGGFSYGDVLGAGEGWAKSILFNSRLRDSFATFFARDDTFALGMCNGCQMMSALREIIPGASAWPHFVRNRSEQFEARLVMVEVPENPSLFFDGMARSRLPIVVSHGEGYAEFADNEQFAAAQALVALRFVDHCGMATENYPMNPNGSPGGITGLTTRDGRFTILMPHPERGFRTVQNSWHPQHWGEDGAWLRLFRNARKWLG